VLNSPLILKSSSKKLIFVENTAFFEAQDPDPKSKRFGHAGSSSAWVMTTPQPWK
jgi:hypothetical protein